MTPNHLVLLALDRGSCRSNRTHIVASSFQSGTRRESTRFHLAPTMHTKPPTVALPLVVGIATSHGLQTEQNQDWVHQAYCETWSPFGMPSIRSHPLQPKPCIIPLSMRATWASGARAYVFGESELRAHIQAGRLSRCVWVEC